MGNRDAMSGFIRLHVLHQASIGPAFGIGIIERLAFHGYVLSPGTLYPILHGLEKDGALRSHIEIVDKKRRRVYVMTTEGRKIFVLTRMRLWELFKEVFEKELSPDTSHHIEEALRLSIAAVSSSGRPRQRVRKAGK